MEEEEEDTDEDDDSGVAPSRGGTVRLLRFGVVVQEPLVVLRLGWEGTATKALAMGGGVHWRLLG